MEIAYEATKSLLIVLLIFSIGEIISIISKGIISKILIISFLLIIGFTYGLPRDIIEKSQLYNIGIILLGVLVAHLGTTIDYTELKKQWKTVLIALSAEFGIALILMTVGVFILGRQIAIVSISPTGGGIVATLIMHKTLEVNQLSNLIIYTTLLLSFSNLVGYPLASIFLKFEAKRLLTNLEQSNINYLNKKMQDKTKSTKRYNTDLILFTKIVAIVFFSFFISKSINGYINEYVICLILSFLVKEIGFLEKNILIKANIYGFAIVTLLAVLFAKLETVNFSDIKQMIYPITVSLIFSIIGMLVFGYIAGKLLKESIYMSLAISIACLFGFPGTHIIPNEIVLGISNDKQIQKKIYSAIHPKMIIAGFVNVSVISIIIANILIFLI